MATIPASAIVNVIPGVLSAGGNALDLVGVILTTSTRVPIGTVQSFPSALAVANFFGPASTEAGNATVYFNGYINETATPAAMLFAQYNQVAVSAYLRTGNVGALPLSTLQSYTGSLTITVDGYVRSAASINLAGASSFTAAAALIQAGLNATPPTAAVVTGSIAGTTLTVTAVTSGTLAIGQTLTGSGVVAGTQITALLTGSGLTGTYTVSATQTVTSTTITAVGTAVAVAYDSVSGGFTIASTITGAPSTVGFATGTLAANILATSVTGAILSQGAAPAVPTPFMNALTLVTQNWATFMTNFDPDNGTGNAIKLLFAAWTSNQNNRYAYICGDTDITPTATSPATQSLGYLISQNAYSGTCLIYQPTDLNLPAFICGAVASINFYALNGRITTAFKSQAGLTASVTSQAVGANLIANGYNFYGAYATANQNFLFFYPGQISGQFLWLDSYVNQIWLNNQLQLALMTLLTSIGSIPYNQSGYALIEAGAAGPIALAKTFGALRPGVTLSALQIANVNNAAGKIIDVTLSQQGYYFLVQDAAPQVRSARKSPTILFYYVDGQSVQQITLNSTDVL